MVGPFPWFSLHCASFRFGRSHFSQFIFSFIHFWFAFTFCEATLSYSSKEYFQLVAFDLLVDECMRACVYLWMRRTLTFLARRHLEVTDLSLRLRRNRLCKWNCTPWWPVCVQLDVHSSITRKSIDFSLVVVIKTFKHSIDTVTEVNRVFRFLSTKTEIFIWTVDDDVCRLFAHWFWLVARKLLTSKGERVRSNDYSICCVCRMCIDFCESNWSCRCVK